MRRGFKPFPRGCPGGCRIAFEYPPADLIKAVFIRAVRKRCAYLVELLFLSSRCGACPIGAFQAVVGSSKFSFSYYVTGFLILTGVLLGRFVCGFLCPFGWLQELLHKIPGKKLSTSKLKPLRYVKYGVLALTVVLLPAVLVNDVGMGDPLFCKYICPQGVLEVLSRFPSSIAASDRRWGRCSRGSLRY